MDQALKSLIASEEEVVASLGLSRQWHLFSLTPRPSQLRVSGYCLSLAEGTGRGGASKLSLLSLSLTTLLFSFLLRPSPHCATPPHPAPLSHLTVPSRSILPHAPAVNVGT